PVQGSADVEGEDSSGDMGELRLPSKDGATDTRRRGTTGRERASADAAEEDADADSDAEDSGDDPDTAAERPATFRNLDGVTIALAPASATAAATTGTAGAAATSAGSRVRVGPLRTTCAGERVIAALAVEIALLDRLDRILTTAGARVTRLDDPATRRVACRDARAAALGAADWFLVVAAVQPTADPSRVIAARTAGTLPAVEQQRSALLAQELAAALQLPRARTTAKQSATDAVAALTAGALDLPGGGAGALYLLTAERRSGTDLDTLATQLATGFAGVVTRGTAADPATD
ncbi:MAG: hypothetical protein JWM25_1301, partial [Thermoleophilia bacterium]|nr:hypothetical protein [Thermoleophilia bacterium]